MSIKWESIIWKGNKRRGVREELYTRWYYSYHYQGMEYRWINQILKWGSGKSGPISHSAASLVGDFEQVTSLWAGFSIYRLQMLSRISRVEIHRWKKCYYYSSNLFSQGPYFSHMPVDVNWLTDGLRLFNADTRA